MNKTIKERRKRALNMIINGLEKIDEHNIISENKIMLDIDKLADEIVKEFQIGIQLAHNWIVEAKKMYNQSHEVMIRQEMLNAE